MRTLKTNLQLALALGVYSAANLAAAQHADVLVQLKDNKLYTGVADLDEFEWSIGARVFARDFDSDYRIDTPGYNALTATSSTMPPGYSALPASSSLSWDFLPMRIETAVANLMHWNGLDANANGVDLDDVDFHPAVGNVLSLQGLTGTATADATNQLITGHSLGNTGSNGSIHVHRNYQLSVEGAGPGEFPADGIYLLAMQLRMAGLETADPFFLVFGTPGSTFAARGAAAEWVGERVDTLTSLGIPGDYNDDGRVDAADYTVWRNHLNQSLSLSNETASIGQVDQEDYAVWKSNFGQSNSGAAAASAAAVPEPASLIVALAAVAVTLLFQPRAARRGSESIPRRC